MAVSLVGEVVNTADATTGYNTGGISTDDDFVQGSGAIGVKVSATTTAMYTTSLGATAPYDFSSGGSEFGWHIIMWFNSKSPINATAGFRIVVGNGTSRGHWNVVPAGFYKGGFVTQVVNTARNFDTISAGSWTVGGNPGQLTNVTQMGGVMQTPASIMGSFNNFQLDQFTIGLGVRADAGTVGSPNTFETVRSADESTNFWGWWSSKNGAYVGKGKLYIGPASGSAKSVFSHSAFSVVFSDQRVAAGFYEINTRGAGTDVTWSLANISAANPSNARWSLTIQSDTNSFSDTNGVWSGADQLVLHSGSTLTSTTLINCSKLTQNGATLDGITVLSANTGDGIAFIESGDPSLISNGSFTFSDGHAIEITTPGSYSFSANTFSGYGGTPGSNLDPNTGSTDAAIYNNSNGAVTLTVTDGGTIPSVRNGANASTVVQAGISLTLIGFQDGTEIRIYATGTNNEVDGTESATAPFVASLQASTGYDIKAVKPGRELVILINQSFAASQTLDLRQKADNNYVNP